MWEFIAVMIAFKISNFLFRKKNHLFCVSNFLFRKKKIIYFAFWTIYADSKSYKKVRKGMKRRRFVSYSGRESNVKKKKSKPREWEWEKEGADFFSPTLTINIHMGLGCWDDVLFGREILWVLGLILQH